MKTEPGLQANGAFWSNDKDVRNRKKILELEVLRLPSEWKSHVLTDLGLKKYCYLCILMTNITLFWCF